MDREAYDEASEILLEAMLEDADRLGGKAARSRGQSVVFAVARELLVRLYEIFRATLVEEHKRDGNTVAFRPICFRRA